MLRTWLKLSGMAAAAVLIWLFLWPLYLGGHSSYVVISGPSMEPVYHSGDLVVAREQRDYEVGDIVVFETEHGNVIHRITGGDAQSGFETQGDNNPDPDTWMPTGDEILGRAWLHAPAIGDVVLTVKQVVLTPPMPYLIAGFVFLVIVLGDDKRGLRHDPQTESDPPAEAGEGPTRDDQAVGAGAR